MGVSGRVLVSGCAGFIGYHLARRLLDDGCTVVGVDNLVTGQRRNYDELAAHPRFTRLAGDIAALPRIEGHLDYVMDFACPASPVDFEEKALDILHTCSSGVRRLLDLAVENGAVFVHASTSECYGDPQESPQKESYWGHVNPIGIRSPYDEGKRFAEALTMAYQRRCGLRTRLVRTFNTYGPRMRPDDGRALPNFINQALAGEPLTVYGDGSQTRSFCYVDDQIEGIVRLAASSYGEPVNIGNPVEVTLLQVAREVIELAGSRSTIEFRPLPKDDPARRCPDITRARQILGWEPRTDRRTGLLRTIEYFRNLRAGK